MIRLEPQSLTLKTDSCQASELVVGSPSHTASEHGPGPGQGYRKGGEENPQVPSKRPASWAGAPGPKPSKSPAPTIGHLTAHMSMFSRTHTALVFFSPIPTGQGPLGGGIRCPRASSWNTTPSGKAFLRLCSALKTILFSTMGGHSSCSTLVSRAHSLQGKAQPRPWKQGRLGWKSCQWSLFAPFLLWRVTTGTVLAGHRKLGGSNDLMIPSFWPAPSRAQAPQCSLLWT